LDRRLAALLAATALLAAPRISPAQPTPLASVAPNLDQAVGVYKRRFANSDVSGDKFASEDIFELVKISPKTA